MTCKGICVRYKAQKPVGTGRYASGQRRCEICEIFIKWEGLWCPCCGYRLRTKPRNLKYKAKLRARVEADSLEAKAAEAKQETEEVPEITVKTKSKAKTTKAKTSKREDSKKYESKDEQPKRKGTIMDIIKHEKELRKEGIEDEAIGKLLEEEFGEKKMDKVKSSKTWMRYHNSTTQNNSKENTHRITESSQEDESIAIKA